MIDRAEGGVLPLINIVFLLLIFFMVVGNLAPADPLVEQPLQAAAGQPQPATEPGWNPLVQVGPTGELALDGTPIERVALLAALAKAVQPPTGVSQVQLKIDGRLDAQQAINLINALRHIGIPSVQLLSLEPDQDWPGGRT